MTQLEYILELDQLLKRLTVAGLTNKQAGSLTYIVFEIGRSRGYSHEEELIVQPKKNITRDSRDWNPS